MSEQTAIEKLAAEAKELMLRSQVIMVNGSPKAADIREVVRYVVRTIFDYNPATDTILTAYPYDPSSNPRDYAAWYRLLEMLDNTVGSNAHHWTNEVFQGSEGAYEYLIGLVRGIIASVLEDKLLGDPELRSLGIERGEDSEQIEFAAQAKALNSKFPYSPSGIRYASQHLSDLPGTLSGPFYPIGFGVLHASPIGEEP